MCDTFLNVLLELLGLVQLLYVHCPRQQQEFHNPCNKLLRKSERKTFITSAATQKERHRQDGSKKSFIANEFPQHNLIELNIIIHHLIFQPDTKSYFPQKYWSKFKKIKHGGVFV